MATLSQLGLRVARRIGQVSGTGVQVYAEDLIYEMIQHKFDVLFDRAWWSQHMNWVTATLDGTTGITTTDWSLAATPKLVNFKDIRAVFPDGKDRALGKFSAHRNPTNISGTTPRFVEPFGTSAQIFRILPILSTGDVQVHYRSKPDNYVLTDEVDFDEQALVLGAAYDYLEDDGTNPGATQKMQNMFEGRVNQLLQNQHNIAFDSDPYTSDSADEWWESNR